MGSRRGFTLLELLLVVTILSAVAWMSLGVVNNNADQARFEDTRNRLQTIRRAIIGDTSRTVNGQPELRGYVADMGRLPNNLQELIIQGSQPDFDQDGNTGLWHGWNGPYLPPGFGSTGKYLDGWGNNDGSNNYGWIYPSDISTITDLVVQSYGRDGVTGGSDGYDNDYPASSIPLIKENEYRHEIGIVQVVMDFTAAAQCFACMYSSLQCINNGGSFVEEGTVSACVATFSTEESCSLNGYSWDPTYAKCINTNYQNKSSCEDNSWNWETIKGTCSYSTSMECATYGGIWKTIDHYVCSDSSYKTQAVIPVLVLRPPL